ncbi:ribose-phosphate diphosphokinase [Rhizobium leguminosarum]|uniref:ribose-phosphate diphosphokinase n=1 Tax=Rhizobium leguminosarum TaxID=384 RepID=UPI001F47D017|nr:ribose-phosphate diphosphokinase [Rhizobium leguminosarum]UIJ83179.1 ribose-phosphate diphosphokinase [Rhizobium leguminosarum]
MNDVLFIVGCDKSRLPWIGSIETKITICSYTKERFANDEYLIVLPRTFEFGDRAFIFIDARVSASEILFELGLLVSAIRSGFDGEIIGILSYMPFSRSSRRDGPGFSLGAKVLAGIIDSFRFSKIICCELHAPEVEGFFQTPVKLISMKKSIIEAIDGLGIEVIVAPDAGRRRECLQLSNELGISSFTLVKERSSASSVTQALAAIDLTNVFEGKNVLIYDDEVLTGTTVKLASGLLRANGARYVAFAVSHLNGYSEAVYNVLNSFDKIIVADTAPPSFGGVNVSYIDYSSIIDDIFG